MNITALAFFLLRPVGVFVRIGFVSIPRAAVVCKLQLIDHDDALIDGTGLRAFVATGAVLVCNIVKPVVGLIKALVRTLQPTERTLGAEVETAHGALILRRAPFEGLVPRLAPRPQFEMAFDRRN